RRQGGFRLSGRPRHRRQRPHDDARKEQRRAGRAGRVVDRERLRRDDSLPHFWRSAVVPGLEALAHAPSPSVGGIGHGPASMSGADGAAGRVAPRAIARVAGFLVLWLVLSGADPADLPAGLVVVVAATWTSLILLRLAHRASRPLPS